MNMDNQGFPETMISDNDFFLLSDLIYKFSGIHLTIEKKTLLVTRLTRILRQYNLLTFKDYYGYVKSDKTGYALSELVEAISTNHTFFFREKEHFDYLLSTALPNIFEKLKPIVLYIVHQQ